MKQLIILLSFCIVFTACKKTNKTGQAPDAKVSVAKVEKKETVYFDEIPGIINALEEVEIRSQVTGFVTEIFFTDGQDVKKGQKLYSLDNQQFKAQYNQARANLAVTQAELEKTRKDLDRYNDLWKKDAIARQKVDYAQADYDAAKMQVEAARQQVNNLGANLRYSLIESPVNGVVGFSQVKKGALVTAGSTILNTISSKNPIAVDFEINEKQVPEFERLRDSVDKDSIFSIMIPDKSIYPETGTVYAFDRAVNPQTGTLKIRLSFPNPQDILKEGMSCVVRVKIQSDGLKALVPAKAIVEQMGEYFVFVLNTSDNTVKQQKITLGKNVGDNTIVEEGLSGDETIVVDGVQKLRSGEKVSL